LFIGGDYVSLLHPSVSEDGSMLALTYAPSNYGDTVIFTMGLDLGQPVITGVQEFIDQPDTSEWSPSFSPDGSQFVFARSYKEGRKNHYEIVTRDVWTGTETILKSSTKETLAGPDWNPIPPLP
jgi:Tol biopolymer transport system component